MRDGETILDVHDGVERLMGDHALYMRTLRRFQDDRQKGLDALDGALAAPDLALAQRLAHTLKGRAGMIGAQQVLRLAGALDQSLRGAPPVGHRCQFEALVDGMATLGLHIDAILRAEAAPLSDMTTEGAVGAA